LKGHADSVFAVAFSSDGKALTTASYDKVVLLWDTETGQVKQLELQDEEEEAASDERAGGVAESESKVEAPQQKDETRAAPLVHERSPWSLSDPETWSSSRANASPSPELEAPPPDESSWGLGRRPGKGGGRGGRHMGATSDSVGFRGGYGRGVVGSMHATTGGIGSIGDSAVGTLGLRTPRGGQLRTRPAAPAQAHCGRGIFKMLSAVERFKPDPTIGKQETLFLENHAARSVMP